MNFNEKALFFQKAAGCICGSLDLELTIGRCFQYFKDYIPLDDIWFCLVDQNKGTFRCKACADISGVKKIDKVIPLSHQLIIELGKQNQVIVNNRMSLDPVAKYITNFLGFPESSSMVLPMLPDGVRIGALVVVKKAGNNQYTELHAELFAMLHDLFSVSLSNVLRHEEVLKLKNLLADDNRYLTQELRQLRGDTIIGEDSGLAHVMWMVRKVALLNNPVLILGETGVGKEIIANAIHYSSTRQNGPFIKVNSGAIPEGLIDTELFGHEKGAFTGAVSQKRGRFERAMGGTIFIDEIGDLPMQAQTRLLRVIQQKEIERVGGTKTITVDARIIAATHRDLEQMIAKNQFREDLWYRLNVFPIFIPPLRERKADIPALVKHFLKKKTKELNFDKIPSLAPGAIDRLIDHPWKGNVRELENIVGRAMIEYSGGLLSFDHFIFPQTNNIKSAPSSSNAYSKTLTLDEINASHIRSVLEKTHGKINGPGGAAELLGIHSSTLRLRMDKLKIPYGKRRRNSFA